MTNGSPEPYGSPITARFDWYSATIDDSPADVERALHLALDAVPVAAAPMHGYESARDFRDGDGRTVAKLLYGGHEKPHALASGADSERFASIVRTLWPRAHAPGGQGGHYVTRFDSAIDYDDGQPVWARLYRSCITLAERKGLRLGTAGDWITPDDRREHGRTLYVGSASSDVQVRLYEKGLQLRESLSDPLEAAAVSPHWVRLEVRVRPQREARYRAALSSPEEGFGYSKWTQELLADVARLDVPRVAILEPRETDDERAFVHLVRQYGKVLARRAAAAGGWAALGLDIERQAIDLGLDTTQ